MINKELLIEASLPLYEVEEVSLADAMILLKHHGMSSGESSISRAAERLKSCSEQQSREPGWPMDNSH
ncbi:MAG: hypothetical protein P8179_10575 [Candidatus Thiodiazotropha sp.]|jgi:hypothetical protein